MSPETENSFAETSWNGWFIVCHYPLPQLFECPRYVITATLYVHPIFYHCLMRSYVTEISSVCKNNGKRNFTNI